MNDKKAEDKKDDNNTELNAVVIEEENGMQVKR